MPSDDVARRPVIQLRVVVEAEDYDEAVRFYRDALGLPEEAAFEAAAQSAKQGIDPSNDIHASEAYRRAVAATLTKRALRAALEKLRKN